MTFKSSLANSMWYLGVLFAFSTLAASTDEISSINKTEVSFSASQNAIKHGSSVDSELAKAHEPSRDESNQQIRQQIRSTQHIIEHANPVDKEQNENPKAPPGDLDNFPFKQMADTFGQQMDDGQENFDEDGSALSSLMEGLFSSAFSPIRLTAGMLSSFSRPKVEFGESDDGKFLVVRLHMSSSNDDSLKKGAQRKVSAAVISSDLLQVHIETINDNMRQRMSNQFSLPKPVARDGMTVSPAEDSTIHIRLRLLKDGERDNTTNDNDDVSNLEPDINELMNTLFGESIHRRLIPLTIGFAPSGTDANDEARGIVEELPSAAHFDRCRHTYADDKLQLRKCLCDVTPMTSRAVCYSKMIAKSMRLAQKMELNGFATTVKNSAHDCVNGTEDKTQCLERVASHVVKYLSHESGSDPSSQKEQIRAALEADDVNVTNFYSTTGFMMLQIIFAAILLSVCFWGGMVYAMRRGWFGNRSGGLLSQLSSALAQRSVCENGNALPTNLDRPGPQKGNSMNVLFRSRSAQKES